MSYEEEEQYHVLYVEGPETVCLGSYETGNAAMAALRKGIDDSVIDFATQRVYILDHGSLNEVKELPDVEDGQYMLLYPYEDDGLVPDGPHPSQNAALRRLLALHKSGTATTYATQESLIVGPTPDNIVSVNEDALVHAVKHELTVPKISGRLAAPQPPTPKATKRRKKST